MAYDPLSILREVLARRPDLHAEFAPRLQAMGVQVAGPSFSGETRRRLDAANALRSGQGITPGPVPANMGSFPPAPPTGLSPDEMALPFNGTGGDPAGLAAMANRNDPSQTPDFRSRMYDAQAGLGSARVPPGSGLAAANTNPTAYVQGQLPGNFMNPGNIPRTRPPEQLTPGGPPPPMAGAAPPSPLAGVGPSAPIIGREAPPGLNGPASPLASRFGDQSQLPGGAFSGSLPRPPQPRPFESTIAGRPMPPGGPGSLPAAPLLAGKPFPSAPGMASRFGDQSQLASGAFSGGSVGPPPPIQPNPVISQGGFKPAPGFDQAMRSVAPPASLPQLSPQMASLARGIPNPADAMRALSPPLAPAAMDARVSATTPPAALPNSLQRAPLNLAAGSGPPPPVGSTNLPFAGIPPTPASVAQRTEMLGPLPPSAGTGAPVRSVQTPLIAAPPASGTVPPVGPVLGQDLPAPPPVGAPPSLASVGPPNPARMEVVANYNPHGKGARQAIEAAAPPPVVPAQQQQKPFWNAPNIATAVGAGAGLLAGGLGGAAAGAGGGRLLGKVIQAIRNRGQTVDAQGNILNKAGEVVGHISDMMGKAGSGMSGIFGGGGGSSGNWAGSMGGNSGGGGSGWGGWGGGGNYGGGYGRNLTEGVGGAYRNR